MELIGVDVGTENVSGCLLVLAQQRRAGEADEDGVLHPTFHLPVHVTTLGAVAFIHKHVEAPMNGRRRTFEIGRIELVDERAQQPGRRGTEFCDELRPRRDAGRRRILTDDSGVPHHALDLFVQFIAVGDDQDAGIRVVLHQPLGEQHHEDALTTTLGVPDDTALALADTLLSRLDASDTDAGAALSFGPRRR